MESTFPRSGSIDRTREPSSLKRRHPGKGPPRSQLDRSGKARPILNTRADEPAIEQLRQALALDPQFALARAHLAYRLMFLSNYDRASYLDEGIKEGEAAVAMDPSLA